MPLCARCLGASMGHIFVAAQFLIFDVPHWAWSFPLLAAMLLDWTSQNKWSLYHSNISRLVTGIMGGYAVGLLIWSSLSGLCAFVF